MRALTFMAICLAFMPLTGLASDLEPTESDSLGIYLERLNREAESSFSPYSLEVVSLPDSTVDSLVAIYERTGEVPDTSTPTPRRFGIEPFIADLRFNRVEGLNLMPGMVLRLPTPGRVELFGAIGYGTASEEMTYEFGFRGNLGRWLRSPEIEVTYARDVRGYGSGNIPAKFIYALVAGNDYGDYYLHEGWSAGLELNLGREDVEVAFHREDHESMPLATDFSFFGGSDPYRPNPMIGKEDLHFVRFGIGSQRLPGATRLRLRGEIAGGILKGDYEYESVWAGLKGMHSLWHGDRALVRAEGGWVDRGAPLQALHHLGGFRTLRGYEVNEFPAREYAHLAVDYEVGKNILGFVPILGRQKIQLVPFVDSAAIFDRRAPSVDSDTRFGETIGRFAVGLGLQKNVFGIPGGETQLRLDIARRLDRGDDAMSYRVIFTSGL